MQIAQPYPPRNMAFQVNYLGQNQMLSSV